ncbi:MAG: hypothetical protein ACLVDB_07605 [Anaeromassilibacillus sp.]
MENREVRAHHLLHTTYVKRKVNEINKIFMKAK